MSIAGFTARLLFALMPFALLLGVLALAYAASETEEHERRQARIKGVIRNFATIVFIIAPLLAPLIIILWLVSLF